MKRKEFLIAGGTLITAAMLMNLAGVVGIAFFFRPEVLPSRFPAIFSISLDFR
jgi:hypothetical protein